MRLKRALFACLVVASTALCLTACSNSTPDFSGTYASEFHGEIRPLIRIYREGDHYMLARTINGDWTAAGVPMQPITREDFEHYVGHHVDLPVSGLTYGAATLVRLPRGFTEGQFVSHTGYLLVTAAGPVEVHKLRLRPNPQPDQTAR